MKSFIILISFLYAGCGSKAKLLYQDASGNNVYEARCNGVARSIGDCYKAASKRCRGDFKPLETDKSSTLMATNQTITPVVSRSFLFTCTDPKHEYY